MTVLHYLINDYEKYFDVALHLIEKHKADPYLLDNKNRNGFMMFAIELNSGDYYQDFDGFGNDSEEISPCYEEKEMYIKKLLKITNPPLEYVRLVYDLFAACIDFDPSLKREYFNKVAAVNVGGKLLSFNDNNDKWIKLFNSIIKNDIDEGLYIKSESNE